MIRQLHVVECDSTQDVLKEQLKDAPPIEGLLVSCDRQLQGRGRGQNVWSDLPGTLCFSLSLAPHPAPSFTAIELSVLIAKFFEGSRLGLKWPNDIWNAQKKKCCGILVQNHHQIMCAGIGINLWSDHPEFGGISDSAFEFDKKAWALEIASFIVQNRFNDVATLKKEWEDFCWHMHKEVVITEGAESVEGLFLGLGQYGEAVLATTEGEKRLFNGSLRLITDR